MTYIHMEVGGMKQVAVTAETLERIKSMRTSVQFNSTSFIHADGRRMIHVDDDVYEGLELQLQDGETFDACINRLFDRRL